MASTALIVFIKNPELGKAKTRLAKTVGNEQALRIYQTLLDHTRQQSIHVHCDRYVFYSRFIDNSDNWSTEYFHKRLQSGNHLGERMTQAFKEILAHHERAIIIGSDCASLTSALIEDAFNRLAENDFVIGPARDGGYYLLGMKKPLTPKVFEDIEWSTDQVFSTTITRIESLQASYALLPVLSDIDTEADWKEFGWEI